MFYDLAIFLYDLLVHLAAPFSRKPRKMMKGHWVVYDLLRLQLRKDVRYIWFHAASLGEFEQGRPLIEKIRARYPEYGILLTFFSPSGYEVRKNYRGADIVCYLPFDKPRNVKKFLDLVNPCMAFFIKYEFWKNYLDELHRRRIPVYSVSSIFRRGQVFFKWYGGTYRNVLRDFDHLFVQNERSKRYLAKIGVNRVTVVGDTRFDRVLQIREEAKDLPLVEADGPLGWEELRRTPGFRSLFDGAGEARLVGEWRPGKHALSHQVIHAVFYRVEVAAFSAGMAGYLRVEEGRLGDYAVSRLAQSYFEKSE